jgi:hypothetical protein
VRKNKVRRESLVKQDPAQRAMALFPRADRGDRHALVELRALFEAHPGMWESVGDMASHAEAAMVRLVAGENEVTKDAVGRKLKSLKREIAGDSPSPLERLLVDRIVACWLMMSHAEFGYAEALRAGGLSLELSEYHQRRCERTQRRYLAAIRMLAQVRRLLVPMVQVNIAEQQDVAQVAAPDRR